MVVFIYVFFRGWLDIFANDFQLFNEVQKHWQIIVLKGQYNLAQGKRRRSVALGWRMGKQIVRVIMVKKEHFLFRTKGKVSDYRQIKFCYSVRRSFSFIKIMFTRTVFFLFPLPRATFRIVPPETLPWAELYWPFRPGKYTFRELCIKIRLSSRGERVIRILAPK